MHYIKNITLKPAQGGYIICCEKHKESSDSYDGMRYVGEHKIVVEDGVEAIAIVDKMFEASVEGGMIELPEGNYEDKEGRGDTDLMKQD